MRSNPALALLALSLTTASAQELRHIDVPVWRQACYDPIRSRVVAPSIGGYSTEWDGSVWRQSPDVGAPQGFCYVDSSTARLNVVAREFVGTGFLLTMWERVGSEWQVVNAPTQPPLRNDIALCYDPVRDELMAFGGFSPATLMPLGDTWVWDGVSWTQRLVAGPPPRANATTSFDSTRQRVVMFGGYASQTNFLNDTWEWDGAAWVQVVTPTSASPQIRGSADYDVARQRTVMIGPASSTGHPVRHWEYDGLTWRQMTAPLPTQNLTPVVVHDTARNETLLLGGYTDTGYHGESWAWNGTSWSQRAGYWTMPFQTFGSEVATHPTANDIQLFGPYSSANISTIDELWTFDGSSWSVTATGGPSPRHEPVFWRFQNESYVFGGLINVTVANDLWRWNGNAWSQVTTAISPPARSRATGVVDVIRNRAILFGGYTGSGWANDTWIFDGVSWTQAFSASNPSPRYWTAMGFDPIRDRVVLYGGVGGPGGTTPLTDTWEWDGAQWQQVLTGAAPPRDGDMTFDPVSQKMLYFAPDPNTRDYEAWSYDGATWTQLVMVGTEGSNHPLRASLPRPVTTSQGIFVADQYSGLHKVLPVPARTEHYGMACGNDAPELAAGSLPRVPAGSFVLDVTHAPANAPVRIAGANTSAVVPFFGCSLLVAANVTTLFSMSSATGHAEFAVAIPNTPALIGAATFFQAATLALSNPNGFALSDGLRVDLGM